MSSNSGLSFIFQIRVISEEKSREKKSMKVGFFDVHSNSCFSTIDVTLISKTLFTIYLQLPTNYHGWWVLLQSFGDNERPQVDSSIFIKMGRVRNNRRKTSKSKEYKKAFKTDNRARDVDQIQEDLIKEKEAGAKMAFEADDDLPGLGQFYCTPCGRHFFDQASLTSHADSRGHIRRWTIILHHIWMILTMMFCNCYCYLGEYSEGQITFYWLKMTSSITLNIFATTDIRVMSERLLICIKWLITLSDLILTAAFTRFYALTQHHKNCLDFQIERCTTREIYQRWGWEGSWNVCWNIAICECQQDGDHNMISEQLISLLLDPFLTLSVLCHHSICC